MNYIALFEQTAQRSPAQAALIDREGTRSTSYAELDRLSGQVAGKLRALGIPSGSFVLINLGRCMEYQAAYLGVLKAGCVLVPVVPDYPEERVGWIRDNCDAKLIITEAFFADIDTYAPFCAPAENAAPAILSYTSGSTGSPKGILFSTADLVRAVLRQQIFFRDVHPLVTGSLCQMSFLIHVFEYLTVYSLGGTIHIVSDETRKSAAAFAKYFEKHRITAAVITPQLIRFYENTDPALQVVVSCSERLTQVAPNGYRLYNAYGMSESLALVTCFDVDRAYDNTPIGKAIDGATLEVCDEDWNRVPAGTEGEICICAPFDTCYYKDPDRTARTMERLPDGRVAIHSGDIGYVNEDGNLVYVNRKDWMVKVNGQRVETMEIESLLLRIPEITSAAVKAFEDEDRQTYLAAYYVLRSAVSETMLRQALRRTLPEYMIPRFFVPMTELPKNLHGKLDRRALLPPSAEQFKEAYAAPRTSAEAALCEVFSSVLHCGRVGIHDDFFALGGDSIKVLRLLSAADLPGLTPAVILSARTPEAIAALADTPEISIEHHDEIPAVCPLTDAQRGVYLECANDPASVMYNIPFLCRLPEGTDRERFLSAVRTVAEAHPALFVTVQTPNGVPSMVYAPHPVRIAEVTAQNLTVFAASFVQPFDLENGPLYRFTLCSHPGGLAFLFDVHHLVFDGSSVDAFLSQLAAVYGGGAVQPEALTVFDVAASEQTLKETDAYRAAQNYFKKLDGVDCDSKPVSDLVLDEVRTGAGCIRLRSDGSFSADEVLAFTKRHRITENTLFAGAFAYALAKFCGTADSLFCTASNGRHDPRLSSSVGMFVKTLPLYFRFDEGMRVSDFLAQAQDDLFETLRHDCISFGELAAQYGVNTDIVFVYQSELLNGAELDCGLMKAESIELSDAQSDLDVMLLKTESGYSALSHYRRSQYSGALVRSFVELFFRVVRGMLSAETLGEIALTDARCEAALEQFNRTEADYPADRTIVDLFRAQAEKTPDNPCVVYTGRSYTYREVDDLSDRLAGRLRQFGVGAESIVGVLIPRCEYMLIASLGVLKAGGAYMPMDPTYPPERLNLMMQDSGALVLIADPALSSIITDEFTGARLTTDEIQALPDCDVSLPAPGSDDLFILLYTSGSTGLPKGVMYNHSNALVTVAWEVPYYEMDEHSRIAVYASYGFDADVYDLYPPMLCGGCVHIIADDIRLDLPALRDYFNQNHITHAVMTMQVGRQFAQIGGLKTLRHLSVAGEKLTPLDVPEGFCFYNLYGPSEGSVITSAYRMTKRCRDVPIGYPVENLKVYVVDKNRRRLPAGAVGELWISGPHVTRGYRNRPEKTAEAYGLNPFPHPAGYERIYRTGDIVRLLADGNLQFVGRRDAQVKVRGFRVELTEVEEVVRRFPGVQDATVAAFDDPAGGKFLTAYVVSDETIDVSALNAFIRAEKPPYMVPAVTMQIDRIPLNQNQKVNRRALPVPQRKAEDLTPPESETQQKIFDCIAEILGHSAFGVDTDLYEAGLTSIGAVRLNVALGDCFTLPVKISDIKANPTVRKLEAFLLASKGGASYALRDDYPLTQTQNGIFVECLSNPGTTMYNIPLLLKLDDGIDPERLLAAVTAAVNAHPAVKTHLFCDQNGEFRARRRDDAPVCVGIVEGKLPEQLVRPFTLTENDLYRIELYKTHDGNYLFMDFHHIISDGTSEAILLSDTDRAYAGEALKPEGYSAFEAALDEEALRKTDALKTAKTHYDALFAGCEADNLPVYDNDLRPAGVGSCKLVSGLSPSAVRGYCQQHGVSENAFFNGVFGYVLSRFAGKDEAVYTTVYHGRSDSRMANAVSMFVKTLPVLWKNDNERTIPELLQSTGRQILGSMESSLYSFAEISKEYDIRSDIIFVYQGDSFTFDTLCGKPCRMIPLQGNQVKAPITVNVNLVNGKYELLVEFENSLYSEDFMQSFAEVLSQTAGEFLEKDRLSEVELLSEAQKENLDAHNRTELDFDRTKTVVDLFMEQAAAQPEHPCVIHLDKVYTYREVDELTDRLAGFLNGKGIGHGDVVSVLIPRCAYMVICALGVLKSGAAYQPLDPSYPVERLEFMVKDADAKLVIADESLTDLLPGYRGEFLLLNSIAALPACGRPQSLPRPEDLFVLLYTSGSTGTPKGVMLEHGNLAAFCHWYQGYGALDADSRVAAYASFGFDACMMDLYPPLVSGAAIHIVDDSIRLNFFKLNDYFVQNGITHSTMTTQVGRQFSQITTASSLKTLGVGGEALVPMEKPASFTMLNCYGPTETTICVTHHAVQKLNRRIPIGTAQANTKLYIVDPATGKRLPAGIPGELWVAGLQVARGYLNRPEKTAEVFIDNPFDQTPDYARIYRTGDVARVLPDGTFDFIGRNDSQVKVRGFRIELTEVEEIIRRFPGIKDATVTAYDDPSGGKYLAAYVVSDKNVDISAMNEFIKTEKPPYMVPAVTMQIDKIPLNQNQKVNRKALPAPVFTAERKVGEPPRNTTEKAICDAFGKVLGLNQIGIRDSFFDLGGSSISAAKVTMLLMSGGLKVEYGDIFDHPTPAQLAEYLGTGEELHTDGMEYQLPEELKPTLKFNTVAHAKEVRREPLGDVLLAGATGYLGIHVLKELIDRNEGRIFCLLRGTKDQDAESRLKTLLVYYFDTDFADLFGSRIVLVEGDITDEALPRKTADLPFRTLINCAACVKHYASDDILERINVWGVENLIGIAKQKNARMVQISTTSVTGLHTDETFAKKLRMHEDELFIINSEGNKYCLSKFHAEIKMLEAIKTGLRGKIMRVGNLMGRHKDGEFQINYTTNMFMNGVRGFAAMGMYPISHMTDPMSFSPIDCTAKAIVLLAGTNDQFTAFNADNRYSFDEMKLIDACNRCQLPIVPTDDDEYYAAYHRKLGDIRMNSVLNGLAANDRPGMHMGETDNEFTTNILYRLGFSWPLTDDAYLDRVVNSLRELDFFELDEPDDDENEEDAT